MVASLSIDTITVLEYYLVVCPRVLSMVLNKILLCGNMKTAGATAGNDRRLVYGYCPIHSYVLFPSGYRDSSTVKLSSDGCGLLMGVQKRFGFGYGDNVDFPVWRDLKP